MSRLFATAALKALLDTSPFSIRADLYSSRSRFEQRQWQTEWLRKIVSHPLAMPLKQPLHSAIHRLGAGPLKAAEARNLPESGSLDPASACPSSAPDPSNRREKTRRDKTLRDKNRCDKTL
jgi:hypothetical protein